MWVKMVTMLALRGLGRTAGLRDSIENHPDYVSEVIKQCHGAPTPDQVLTRHFANDVAVDVSAMAEVQSMASQRPMEPLAAHRG